MHADIKRANKNTKVDLLLSTYLFDFECKLVT